MQKNVMRLVHKKRWLWKVYTKTKDYEHLQAYKNVESNVKKAVKNAKKQFEKKLAKDAKKKF